MTRGYLVTPPLSIPAPSLRFPMASFPVLIGSTIQRARPLVRQGWGGQAMAEGEGEGD